MNVTLEPQQGYASQMGVYLVGTIPPIQFPHLVYEAPRQQICLDQMGTLLLD
jgi:hypothetical protein